MDNVRKEFEEWANSAEFELIRFNDGYEDVYSNTAWQAWQASRSALCIELPKDPGGRWATSYEEGFSDCLSIVTTSIEEVGVSSK